MTTPKILIVDDDPDLRQALRRVCAPITTKLECR